MTDTTAEAGAGTAEGTESLPAHDRGTYPVFHLPVADDGTIRLPPDLMHRLEIEPGDSLAFSVTGRSAYVSRTTRIRPVEPVEHKKAPELAGLLKDYFRDREDVQRFIEEERRGREEPEQEPGA